MNYAGMSDVRTSRLILRKLRMTDVETYFERLGSSADVTRGMLWEPHQHIRDSEESIRKALRRYAEGRCYRWAVALAEDDSVIGVVELLAFDETDESCSFAYMIAKEFWGRGYGTEALRAAMDFAFTRLDVKRIRADHFADNPASGAVMRKVGMQYQGTLPGKYEKRGRKIDAQCYSIAKAEFYHTNSRSHDRLFVL